MNRKLTQIAVQGENITILQDSNADFISLTDLARRRNPDEPKDAVKNWLRNRSTIEFLGLWEKINNPNFKGVEFDAFLFEAGSNSFTLSPEKWIAQTSAAGIVTKRGKGGGTFAHKDIAVEFASWISPEFKLYLIKEFQRLKEEEQSRGTNWNLNRTLAKVNYRIHTDAIKDHLIPPKITKNQASNIYASEADLLNTALYGMTSKEWRDANPGVNGNVRDHSSMEQLLILANLESLNAEFIRMGIPSEKRIVKLNEIARNQMQSLLKHPSITKVQGGNKSSSKT